jgi:hypothetical protein
VCFGTAVQHRRKPFDDHPGASTSFLGEEARVVLVKTFPIDVLGDRLGEKFLIGYSGDRLSGKVV